MSREYPQAPIVGVGAVIIDGSGKDARVVLIRRDKPPRAGKWSLPGGAQELGEGIYDAARREIFEETGLQIKVLGMIDVVDSINKDDDGHIRYHYTLVDIAARVSGGELCAGDDACDAKWFSLEDIRTMELPLKALRIIEDALEQHGNDL